MSRYRLAELAVPPPAPSMLRGAEAPTGGRKWLWLSLAVLALGALVAGLVVWLGPDPAGTEPATRPPLVEVEPAAPADDALVVRGFGVVRPRERLPLAAQVAGEVEQLHPDLVVGGRFERGEPLLVIDRERYEANVAAVRADLRSTRATLDFTRTETRRVQSLVQQGVASQQELEQLQTRAAELQARVAALRAQLRTARLDLRDSTLEAPFDGRVAEESVAEGQYLAPGEVVAQLYPVDSYEVEVRLEDDDAALLHHAWSGRSNADLPARVEPSEGGADTHWTGYVARMTQQYDQATQTLGVVVQVDEPRSRGPRSIALLPDRFVEVLIETQPATPLVAVPIDALRGSGEVWMVDEAETLRIVPVRVVHRGRELAYLDAGPLQPGDAVVTSPLSTPVDGMRVRVADGADEEPA